MDIGPRDKLRVEALMFDLGDTLIDASEIADIALMKAVGELINPK